MILRTALLGASLVIAGSAAASAADLIIPTTPQPIVESAGFDWSGLYVGARGGLTSYANNGGASSSWGVVGAAVGANFIPVDPILLGLEVTADYYWNNVDSGTAVFFNLKGGVVVSDNALIYAIGGVGIDTSAGVSTNMYQLGGGVEFAVTDAITVRGEVVGLGDFDGAADSFFEGAQATVGLFYHF